MHLTETNRVNIASNCVNLVSNFVKCGRRELIACTGCTFAINRENPENNLPLSENGIQ
jgi:hypothetical protein